MQKEQLAARLEGLVLGPEDAGYDSARRIWNASIDKRPALIVRCATAADVAQAITFAREGDMAVSVKCGGHNVAGNAVVDDGLMIDLSPMQEVHVDSERRLVRAQGGCVLGAVDRAAQSFGLAVPAGVVSHTGLSGLALGGGQGWLSRRHGYTVDNFVSVELVTAAGEVVRASEDENPDLFWGVRGGGGNFGVVTEFELQAHPVGPHVLAGVLSYRNSAAARVLRAFRDFAEEAPRELTCYPILVGGPPDEQETTIGVCYCGDPDAGKRALAPLRSLPELIGDDVEPRPFAAWQSYFDEAQRAGMHNYWKSDYLASLTDDAIDVLVDHARGMASPLSCIFLVHLGGAICDQDEDATAFGHRVAQYNLELLGAGDTADELEPDIAWAREAWAAMRPFGMQTVYVNNISPDEGEDRVRDAYSPAKYARLAKLKAKYDPTNFFRLNHNIKPADRDSDAVPIGAADD
jgi:FAD/FMN-containing dehydrogenase